MRAVGAGGTDHGWEIARMGLRPGWNQRWPQGPIRGGWFGIGVLIAGLLAGCVGPPEAWDRAAVSHRLQERTGFPVVGAHPPDHIATPPELQPGQKLGEEGAVLVALWNNAAFQELLTELEITRADLVQAGLLP